MLKALLDRIIRELREFPANMKELLTTPRTLILFIIGIVLLVYVSTSGLMFASFAPAILAIGVMCYLIFLYHRQGYKLDRWQKVGVTIFTATLVVGSVYSYEILFVNDIQVANFPQGMLNNKSLSPMWTYFPSQDASESAMYYLLRVETRGFRTVNLNPAVPPYPGAIWLVTVKTVFIPPSDMIRQQVEDKLAQFKDEGVTFVGAKVTGHEVLANGHEAEYLEQEAIVGEVTSGFYREVAVGARVTVKAEWWSCPEHGTAIIAVGAAQHGNTLPQSRIQQVLIGPQPENPDTVALMRMILYRIECA